MTTGDVLLDTDTLSEIIKGRDFATQRNAQEYLGLHQRFQFSIITRYEILRGLKESAISVWRPGGLNSFLPGLEGIATLRQIGAIGVAASISYGGKRLPGLVHHLP